LLQDFQSYAYQNIREKEGASESADYKGMKGVETQHFSTYIDKGK
jgi:hypothetical protein